MIQIKAIVSVSNWLSAAQQKHWGGADGLHQVGPLPQAEQEIAGLELGTRAVGITGMPALSAVM